MVGVVLAGVPPVTAAEATWMSFENVASVEWGPVSWSDDPFYEFSISDNWASDGEHSLRLGFGPGEWKWGGALESVSADGFDDLIAKGGKLSVDLYIPEQVAGISHIGLALQQPGAAQGDWQQVWFEVAGKSGLFTIELPFTRESDQSVNIFLGKTTTSGDSFFIYLDNFRIEPAAGTGETLDPVPIQSFESQEALDLWVPSDWSGDPFSEISPTELGVTDGAYSMAARFASGEWKWGINWSGVDDPILLEALTHGGNLLVDLFVPEESAGISHIGFSIEQPDATQPENWQQNWFNLGGATGAFTIEIPVVRASTAAVNFHLGKNAPQDPIGDSYLVYFDNLRFIPNAPPSGPEPVIIEIPILGFEDQDIHGFGPTGFSNHPFHLFEASPMFPSQGAQSLKVLFNGAEWQWGGTLPGFNDLDGLRAINRGFELLVDVTIPEEFPGIQNVGLVLQEPDVTDSWQQAWFSTGGQTGTFTIRLPYSRLGSAPVNIHLGQRAADGVEYTAYFDNFRVKVEQAEAQGAAIQSTASLSANNEISLNWDSLPNQRYDVLRSTQAAGPYEPFASALEASPFVTTTQNPPTAFFQVRTQSVSQPSIQFVFFDDLEGNVDAWDSQGDGSIFEHGSPSNAGPSSAFSGARVFGTNVDGAYLPGTFTSLKSPLIDLSQVNQSRTHYLSFRYFIDAEFQSDGGMVHISDESGQIIVTDLVVLSGQFSHWKGALVPLPAVVLGNRIHIEFYFLSDFLEASSGGLYIDDIGIELAPER